MLSILYGYHFELGVMGLKEWSNINKNVEINL